MTDEGPCHYCESVQACVALEMKCEADSLDGSSTLIVLGKRCPIIVKN